jgi:hypothetical protein
MQQPTPSRRAQVASAVNRRTGRREREVQRDDVERRVRRAAAWIRSFRTR